MACNRPFPRSGYILPQQSLFISSIPKSNVGHIRLLKEAGYPYLPNISLRGPQFQMQQLAAVLLWTKRTPYSLLISFGLSVYRTFFPLAFYLLHGGDD